MPNKLQAILREMFFGALALGILYDQVFVAVTAQPLLVFLAIFFLGSIPALRGDKNDKVGPFARFILSMMGVALPTVEERDKEEIQKNSPDSQDSSQGTH